jgi:molybdate transport system regulatory protein
MPIPHSWRTARAKAKVQGVTIRLTLRLDFADGTRLGHGKIRLLEAIAQEGSISSAGRALGMSYRRAWRLADNLNRTFAEPVILAQRGGRQGGGAKLTELGDRLVARYRRMEAEASSAFAADLGAVEAALAPGITAEARPSRRP